MVITLMKGGLGNQMFQYATARGISRKKIYIDPTFFKNHQQSTATFTSRSLEVLLFPHLKAQIANPLLLKLINSSSFLSHGIRHLAIPKLKYYTQKENEFIGALLNEKGPVYLDGYFQSEKYFLHKRKELISEFEFPAVKDIETTAISKKIQSISSSVSIHVRRGDYLKPNVQNYHGTLTIAYYKDAVRYIESKISNPVYYIFSDDIDWCKQNFSFLKEAFYVEHNRHPNDAWKDMYLMSLCSHHILANSSFSWWGAWLSTNHSAINIAPKNWFNPQVASFDIHDLIPDQWVLISYD